MGQEVRLFHPYITPSAYGRVNDVLSSGWIGLGPETLKFEQEFAKYIGAKYAVGVNCATSALHLATVVSNFQPCQQIITTPLTFVATNSVLLQEKLIPVFADVEPDTLNISVDSIRKMITSQTAGIMVVHYAGNPAKLEEIYELADFYKLKVIEDAAHACGANYLGKKVGSFGLTCFSFHAVKNLPTGDGGMITTDDAQIYNRLLRLRWSGIDKSTYDRNHTGYKWEYAVTELGYKYYMNDITAAIGREQLPHLDRWNLRRQEIASRYKFNLSDKVEFLTSNSSSNHLCVIKVNDRNSIIKKLATLGIETGVHYKPNTEYSIFNGCPKDSLVNAYDAYDRIISLPLHLNLSNEDVDYVSNAIRNIY